MKRIKKKYLLAIAVALIAVLSVAAVVESQTAPAYTVIARNDLGMHCACPSFAGFLLLPPFNTIRVQVLKRGGDSVSVVSSGITVNYSIAEETTAQLQADPYFSQWITYSPKLFPGFKPIVNGVAMGIAGYGITGTATYNSTSMSWNAVGIPAYPVTTGDPTKDIMTDPLGGPNRDPYLTANITVKNSSTGAIIGTTSTVVPVAFGGCCGCHLKLAGANGYPQTPAGSFTYMGIMHSKNSSGINIALIDPDGDGVGGPVRCSWCHWDPAMGEAAAPGWPAGTKTLPGAGTLKKSVYSFSDVLHRFHVKDALVTSSTYDPNIAKNCYDCHPGNNVNCYRGIHKSKTLWCTDCHGDLNQRVATGQMTQPWQESTLPSCYNLAKGVTSTFACHAAVPQTTWNPGLFGYFINGRGGMGSKKVLCESCHGSAHGESPSTLALDNVENAAIHDMFSTTFPAGKDKTYALGTCKMCHTNEGNNVWSPRVMYGE
jgi:hypothetical protein